VLVFPRLDRAHTLRAADFDGDGDQDLLVAQMHTSRERRVMVLYNANGAGTSWTRQVIATTGLHNGVVADIDRDGDPDVFGANYRDTKPVRLWLNQRR
jgi:hypothetical protein